MLLRPSLLPALGVFAVAARHANFAQAAQELNLTASAVSHHVRRLEEVLDTRLFLRHARGVRLTAEGRQLADAASAAFADVAAVAHHLQPDAESVPLRVATLRSLSYCWLVPRLPRFQQRHPHIHIELHTGSGLDRYDENGPQVGIRYGMGQWPGLHAQHLMDDELFPVASPSLPGVEALQDPAGISELPLLADLSPQGWRDWFRHARLRAPSPLPQAHTFSDSTDAMRAAVYGMGAVLARTHIAQPYLQRYEVVRLPGPAMKARYAYYVVHAEDQPPGPAARLFIDWLLEQAQDDRAPVPALPASLLGRPPTSP
ncbi:LysR substrate-binding domain-containing protein [Stenotrophomonas sp. 24(2023)]|uniref:LysR substrate-binding domain-containing protein n=1 Tax=Stenotrophomonas sp. 24(2023) TaxID=3068324 RepID=UPI0027E1C545|nr:LysR substrate-binding domain-containing protein [Stenotrophomonas sp. 24(2023)]WMJ68477.1 LysR substrate-binding domain-containing protein [Stenotrophomonas sp. 24(2023)]